MERRSGRQRQTVDYTKFASAAGGDGTSDSDDDFRDSPCTGGRQGSDDAGGKATALSSSKPKVTAKKRKKLVDSPLYSPVKKPGRLSVEEKVFLRDLNAALAASADPSQETTTEGESTPANLAVTTVNSGSDADRHPVATAMRPADAGGAAGGSSDDDDVIGVSARKRKSVVIDDDDDEDEGLVVSARTCAQPATSNTSPAKSPAKPAKKSPPKEASSKKPAVHSESESDEGSDGDDDDEDMELEEEKEESDPFSSDADSDFDGSPAPKKRTKGKPAGKTKTPASGRGRKPSAAAATNCRSPVKAMTAARPSKAPPKPKAAPSPCPARATASPSPGKRARAQTATSAVPTGAGQGPVSKTASRRAGVSPTAALSSPTTRTTVLGRSKTAPVQPPANPTAAPSLTVSQVSPHPARVASLSLSGTASNALHLGGVLIKSPATLRLGLSRNVKVRPLHPSAPATASS